MARTLGYLLQVGIVVLRDARLWVWAFPQSPLSHKGQLFPGRNIPFPASRHSLTADLVGRGRLVILRGPLGNHLFRQSSLSRRFLCCELRIEVH